MIWLEKKGKYYFFKEAREGFLGIITSLQKGHNSTVLISADLRSNIFRGCLKTLWHELQVNKGGWYIEGLFASSTAFKFGNFSLMNFSRISVFIFSLPYM